MPLRSRENGRHVSGARMRMASHAFTVPVVSCASAPPATAQVTAPDRTRWKAWPMEWVAEAQAVETA